MTEGNATAPGTSLVASSLMPLWPISLGWELRRGRQVVLHGEVNDRFWLDGEPVTFRDLLVEYLLTTGAQIVGWWDPVDGADVPGRGSREAVPPATSGHAMQAAEPETAAAEPDAADPDPGEGRRRSRAPGRPR